MKPNNKITQERLKEILLYNADTGVFVYRVHRGTCKPGSTAGNLYISRSGKQYIRIKIDDITYQAHRLAWLYIHGAHPDGDVDHINGVGLDNRLKNLRDVSRLDNNKNTRMRKDNKTGHFGVYRDGKKWRVNVWKDGKTKHIGMYKTKDEAISVRAQYERDNGYHINHGKIKEEGTPLR